MNKRDFIKKGFLGLIGVGAALQLKSNSLSALSPSSVSNIMFVPFRSEAFTHLFSEASFLSHYRHHYQESFLQTEKRLKTTAFTPATLRQIFQSPQQYSPALVEQASSYFNHKLFFKQVSSHKNATGKLKIISLIKSQFGSNEKLLENFMSAFSALNGDGWLWLVQHEGNLEVITTQGNDNPFIASLSPNKQVFPLMTIDCWEHAWQADYTSKETYLQAVWKSLNWNYIDKRLTKSQSV